MYILKSVRWGCDSGRHRIEKTYFKYVRRGTPVLKKDKTSRTYQSSCPYHRPCIFSLGMYKPLYYLLIFWLTDLLTYLQLSPLPPSLSKSNCLQESLLNWDDQYLNTFWLHKNYVHYM